MARLLVSLCVALVVLQGTSAMPNPKEIVQKMKSDFFNLANGTLHQIQHVMEEVEETVKEKAAAEVTRVKAAIEHFKEKIHQEAQAVVDKAQAEGKAVENCVEQFGNGLAGLKQKQKDAIGCIANPIIEIKNLTTDLTQAALSINQTVSDGQAALEKCKTQGGVFEQTTCQITTGGQLITQIIEIGTKVSNNIAELANTISTLPSTFSSCETKVWSDAMVLAANNLSNLNLCIKSL